MTETKSPQFDFVPVSCKQGLISCTKEYGGVRDDGKDS